MAYIGTLARRGGHECYLPIGKKPRGSVWECPYCEQQWVLDRPARDGNILQRIPHVSSIWLKLRPEHFIKTGSRQEMIGIRNALAERDRKKAELENQHDEVFAYF